MSRLLLALAAMVFWVSAPMAAERAKGAVRIATFNVDMARKGAGVLIADLLEGHRQIDAVAEIILTVRPDVILLNEIDYDAEGKALDAFRRLLRNGVNGHEGINYAHSFLAPSNTGIPTGHDLDGRRGNSGAGDAHGFGRFPGQYGMAILSVHPLAKARTFQNLLWRDVPWAQPPKNPDGTNYFSEGAWDILRLSSKSHWDVPVQLPNGATVHLLASHPTPPVFDGPENRNGLRNAAEIRFWADYVDGSPWMTDDAGHGGGLVENAHFVILGDMNADPIKGDGDNATIDALRKHPKVQDPAPTSPGASAVGLSPSAATDTADWPEKNGPGNLRVDYALPSRTLKVTGSGVFWPAPDDPDHRLVRIRNGKKTSSDHRLVWVDVITED